jgi:hypothetical protein
MRAPPSTGTCSREGLPVTARRPTEARTAAFARNERLEALLEELNALLAGANAQLAARDAAELHAKVFVVGALRSGTTLFMQWLAASGLAAYPTNLLSRFYGAPLVGARIQKLLADPRYRFRDEIPELSTPPSFDSENGKTRGALAPNEFWYFWRRFLPYGDLDWLPDDELRAKGNLAGLRDELNALANAFAAPFALKAMILNQNLAVLDALFRKAVFVWVRRDPVYNVQSVLQARLRQHGDMAAWYSFRIREYPALKDLDPLHSAAGQVAAINRSLEHAFGGLAAGRGLVVDYEEFCAAPAQVFAVLRRMLAAQGDATGPAAYHGMERFDARRAWVLPQFGPEEVRQACLAMERRLAVP